MHTVQSADLIANASRAVTLRYLRDLKRSVVGSDHFRQSLDMFMKNPGNPAKQICKYMSESKAHSVITDSLKHLNCFRLSSRYRLQLQLRPYLSCRLKSHIFTGSAQKC